jgi:hypothetical protein
MSEILVTVGVIVFFISMYGAVMVGGHLLEGLELDQPSPEPAPAERSDERALPGRTHGSDPHTVGTNQLV